MTILIVAVLIGLPLYVAFCLVRPTKAAAGAADGAASRDGDGGRNAVSAAGATAPENGSGYPPGSSTGSAARCGVTPSSAPRPWLGRPGWTPAAMTGSESR